MNFNISPTPPTSVAPPTSRPAGPSKPDSETPSFKKFWPLRDIPTVLWLVLAAAVAVGHQWLPEPRWLMIHLVLLGAASHAILVWSQHFSYALLHARVTVTSRRNQNRRLALFNLGACLVFVGVLSTIWAATLVGGIAIVAAIVWHVGSLLTRVKAALGARFLVTIWYYVAASSCFVVGIGFGVLLARGYSDPFHSQLKTSHAFLNVFGWLGLTILGTLVTLWPTMLRTKIDSKATATARSSFVILVLGVLGTAGSALCGSLLFTAVWLSVFGVGCVALVVVFARTARQKPPRAFCTYSVAAGLLWLLGCVFFLAGSYFVAAFSDGSWANAYSRFTDTVPFLVAGFVLQVLLGSLAYLVPVAVSSGPASSLAANTEMDRVSVFRVAALNLALVLCVLPVPSVVLVLATMLYLGIALSFLVLMVRAMRAAKVTKLTTSPQLPASQPVSADHSQAGGVAGQLTAAFAVILFVLVAGIAANPASLGVVALGNSEQQLQGVPIAGSDTDTGTGMGNDSGSNSTSVQTIDVEARNMRFYPDAVTVKPGAMVRIKVTNTDTSDVHDLVFPNGQTTGRLAPGDNAVIELGAVNNSVTGWCSILGHKQMGMVFAINVSEADASTTESAEHVLEELDSTHVHAGHSDATAAPSAAEDLDFMKDPSNDFSARDALLPKLPAATSETTTHKLTLEIVEQVMEVSPGVTQKLWTFNGQFPGPALHGRVGDRFEITLVNNGTMGHSIDFHASNVAPDQPMRTIPPGETLQYNFTATRAGIWMYHCGTMPMTAHIANGMAGAVVIEPNDLPEVDKSYLITQSEMYLGAQGESLDVDAALAGESNLDIVAFNGYANQYVSQPLPAKVGERVRVWVLDIGPSRATSFHVVGGQFDRVWAEGNYLLGNSSGPADGAHGGSQALALQPAQGGFVELVFPEPGNYPFVSHIMVDAERGAKGIFRIVD